MWLFSLFHLSTRLNRDLSRIYNYHIEKELNESILKKTALIMLEAEEPNKDFGSREAWENISTYLCGENDQKSFCHFLRGKTKALARMGTFQIRVGKQGFKELLSFLCNIEPNTGEEKLDNPGFKVFNFGIVPQMERFHGLWKRDTHFYNPSRPKQEVFLRKNGSKSLRVY